MSTFTPGPWTFLPNLCNAMIRAKGCAIAEIIPQPGITEANASLIAAAPEMYESANELNALIVKAQQSLARYIVPDSGISDTEVVNELLGIFDGSEQRQAQAKWKAALAKAEGC